MAHCPCPPPHPGCQVRTVRGDAEDGSADTYYTDVLPPVNESSEEVAFFARMDAQLNKVPRPHSFPPLAPLRGPPLRLQQDQCPWCH